VCVGPLVLKAPVVRKKMKVAIHITHEAAAKIGGIGAVIDGVCTAQAYVDFYDRTLLYGPLFTIGGDLSQDLGQVGEILFSSRNGKGDGTVGEKLRDVSAKYGVDIVYGRRVLSDPSARDKNATVDVCLVGIHTMSQVEIAKFKYDLWQNHGIHSDLYTNNWDYEQYLRIAVPYLDVLEALYGKEVEFVHFAHEYMGMPCALSVADTHDNRRHETAFVAHEVSTARFVVETHMGHDIAFYNILRKHRSHKSLEEVFGSQKSNPRNELVKLAVNLDHILSVSDLVREEYLFLVPDAPPEKVKTVHNGVLTRPLSSTEKKTSYERMRQYVDNLFNYSPDVLLTHVSRLVISKGIWRDISLLYSLDKLFDSMDLKGAYILLSTLVAAGRSPDDILRMEEDYGWPVMHREGWPDLVGMEVEIYKYLELFNSRSKAIKGIFVNQFGFDQRRCGSRVPEGSSFIDLRAASDAEFGFSVYEPFGIAEIETIPFGGTAILSSSCGCASLLQGVFADAPLRPFYVLDFIGAAGGMTVEVLDKLTKDQRNTIERSLLSEHARSILDLLPTSEEKRMTYLENALKYASQLSWENAAKGYLLGSSG
jgi:hypothetical protein